MINMMGPKMMYSGFKDMKTATELRMAVMLATNMKTASPTEIQSTTRSTHNIMAIMASISRMIPPATELNRNPVMGGLKYMG